MPDAELGSVAAQPLLMGIPGPPPPPPSPPPAPSPAPGSADPAVAGVVGAAGVAGAVGATGTEPGQASTPPKAPAPVPPASADPPDCNCEEGAPAWVLTFGDLMSLLLTFFILLYSMSSADAGKFEAAAQSLREALGEMSGEFTSAAFIPTDEAVAAIVGSSEAVADATMATIMERLEAFVAENELEDDLEVVRDENGVYLRMQDQAIFAPGSAKIDVVALELVGRLHQILATIDLPVTVSGHTDNVPIRSNVYWSNWELSAARAAGVARALVEWGHDPETVTVEAYGEYRPVADNQTTQGRAQNRRVELYYAKAPLVESLTEGEAAEAVTPDGA